MANETVVRVTGDAEGLVQEMNRGRKSATDFYTTIDTLRQRMTTAAQGVANSRREIAAFGDDALAAFNKSARTAENWLVALQKQAAQAGKTKSELLELRAAEMGVSEAAQPFIDKIKAAEQAMNGGGHAAHEFNLATAGARRELLVLAHEASQGSWKNFGGSLLVLGERTDALSVLMNKTALSIGAVVGVIAMAASITFHARDAIAEYGEQIENLSKKTGISTDSIQQWAFATKSVGVDTKDATKALADLGDAQNKALNGNKDAAKAFSAIGISLADLKKSSPDDLLPKIADAFSKSADSASKAAVANELFGSSGENLIPLLDRGRAGLDDLRAAAEASGAVIGGETVARMAALKEQMELAHAKMDAMALSAKAQLLPTIINLTDALSGNIAMKPLLEDFYSGVGVIMKSAATAIATVAIGFEQISEVIATTAMVTYYAMTGQFKMAVDSAKAGYDNLKREGEGYSQFMSKLWSNAVPPGHASAAPTGPAIAYSKGDGGRQKAYTDDAATRFLQQLRDQAAELQSQLSTTDKLTNSEKELAKFNQQVSDWKGKTLTAEQASLLAHQDQIRAQLQTNVELEKEVAHRQDVQKLLERSSQISASIASYQKGQSDQYARQLDAFGMGSDAIKNAQAVKSIFAEYQHLQEQLDKATPKDLIGGTEYEAASAKIKAGLDQSLADYDAYYASLKVKQGDWVNGFTAGVANYLDSAHNMAAQTEGAFTNVMKGMEDSLTSFVTTGKFNFSTFATSVIADIVRIQARAALSGLLGSGVSGLAGMFGNSFGAAAANMQGGDTLSNFVTNMGGWGTIPGRATGGSVDGGSAYWVGEKGPELFVPGASGAVVPNHALNSVGGGGGVSVQIVNNSNSQVQQPQVSQDSSGQRFIRLIIDQAKNEIAGEMAGGQGTVSKALTQRYGLTPRFR